MVQISSGRKNLWVENKGKKILFDTIFLAQQILDQKIWGPKKVWVQKKCWVQKFCGPKTLAETRCC